LGYKITMIILLTIETEGKRRSDNKDISNLAVEIWVRSLFEIILLKPRL